ncbi:uncharacterized protein LOC110606048 [Manihot esculenta]|uniref:Apple domain-containing protein n=1 Tax=Manihot esculenta TaxID=3983 RepID=A0A2C9U077_MANES|nr:uncharacterized protein LOC110606048 [Manihot esculenta]XP_043808887.1 uncharacterized protein LOC110606048 [Manihot esculenta]XP_043808888.1 uncharacterized protein LOC110606048 [Manihot esculenta]OAY22867.1 hypothetical protein MANES_18G032500v8 [Manihot esculenta]
MARKVKLVCSFSYKRTTLIVCSINIFVALYVLRSLYGSLYIYSHDDLNNVVNYTPDQISMMEESIQIRRAKQPLQLVKMVKKLYKELKRDEEVVELPRDVRQKIADEILQRLRSLKANANITEQREAIESWRKEKLHEVKQLIHGTGGLNSTILQEEARMLVRALDSDFAVLSENIGLWIPVEIISQEHDDKPEGEEDTEEEILPGRPLPPECHAELHTDYDGAAVRWGLTHHKESAADCCQACLDQAKRAKPGRKKCNIWVYCPSEMGCHSPDIYKHKNQECWLKYAEKPRLNFKDRYPESYRNSHPKAPLIVPWVSGVVNA